MLKVKATCETDKCPQKGVTHEFVSDVIQTVCGLCSIEITNIITEEIENGTDTETP